MQRVVKRGSARRQMEFQKPIGVDEVSLRKRPDYLPVVADGRKVLYESVCSRLESIKKIAKTIQEPLWGLLNVTILKVGNDAYENISSRINRIKIHRRGLRNKAYYHDAIYFHPVGLDLYPEGGIR